MRVGEGGSGLATGSIPMREHGSLVVSATSWLPCRRCTTFSVLVRMRGHNNHGPCETADEFFSRGFCMQERMTSVRVGVEASHVCRNADGASEAMYHPTSSEEVQEKYGNDGILTLEANMNIKL